MARFYHLDRGNNLREGQVLETKHISDITSNNKSTSIQLQEHFDILFPNGVCNHGENYFARSKFIPYLAPATELLFEYARLSSYKDKPSRSEVIFGLENLNDFIKLSQLLKSDLNNCTIWEVECESFFRADMYLLDTVQSLVFGHQSILASSKLMNMYWEGKGLDEFIKNDTPFWEYLLVPPIKVIRKVAPVILK